MATARKTTTQNLPTDRLMMALLNNTYGNTAGVTTELLLVVANATPNPIIAMEMLTGLYIAPELDMADVRRFKNHYREFDATIVNFDPLATEPLRITGKQKKGYWFLTEDDAKGYTENGNTYSKGVKNAQTEENTFYAEYEETCFEQIKLDAWFACPSVELPAPAATLCKCCMKSTEGNSDVAEAAGMCGECFDRHPEARPSGITLGTFGYLTNVEQEILAKRLKFVVINDMIDDVRLDLYMLTEEQVSYLRAIHFGQRNEDGSFVA